MPSESRAAAGLLTRPDRTFEVLLHTLPGTRFGLEERWFNVGPFTERLDAQEEFDLLCREFREDSLVVILLVASVHDDATGLYRDRILESRGRAPLIRRDRMASLSAAERKRVLAATAPHRRIARAAGPGVQPRKDPGWPLAVSCAGVLAVVALVVWVLAALPD